MNSVTDLVGDYSNSSFKELKDKRDERKDANETWGDIVDMLQSDVERFEGFADDTRAVLTDSIELYRIKNQTFRTTDAPVTFSTPPDTSFVKTFAEEHKSIVFELKEDDEKLKVMADNTSIIMKEYDETHANYVDFFDKERQSMFNLVSDS